LPDATWAADTSFGIHMQGEHAAVLGPFAEYANYIASEVTAGDILPGFDEPAIYNIDALIQDTIGLIGVFEDAPSAGAYATYKMKGVYPSVGYNYSSCTSGGAGTSLDKPDMGDQGVYTWDQTSENFVIRRDPSIGGEQVLPAFNDGTLIFTDETLDILNIKFKDRDAHSTLYTEIPDQAWDEGAHPSVNNKDSGGDRSYMAFPPVLAVGNLGYGDTFIGSYDPGSTTHNTPGVGPAYVYNTALAPWGNYMTYNAWIFQIEMGYRAATTEISDAAGDGSMADDLVGYMLTALATDVASTTKYFGMPYANLVSMGTDGQTPTITNDSDHDLASTDRNSGGRMKYSIIHNDCAVPANVTIDFDATFTRCAADNCVGDGYHVEPNWD